MRGVPASMTAFCLGIGLGIGPVLLSGLWPGSQLGQAQAQESSADPGQPGAASSGAGVRGTLDGGVVQSPILVIDFERVFAESAFGRRLTAEMERQSAEIVAENRRIEAELTAEEERLTEQRARMAPEDFRVLAEAFDEKVQRLRQEQDAKAAALGQQTSDTRNAFLQNARPVLQTLMREANAAIVLERRTVFVAADAIDITDEVIEEIDARVAASDALNGTGDGETTDGEAVSPATGDTDGPVSLPGETTGPDN